MQLEEEKKLPVTRDSVFTEASQYMQQSASVPTLNSIREAFDTPKSTAILVYLREWKQLNAEAIARLNPTPVQLRKRCERLHAEMTQLALEKSELEKELFNLKDWLATNHPSVLVKWEDYGETRE